MRYILYVHMLIAGYAMPANAKPTFSCAAHQSMDAVGGDLGLQRIEQWDSQSRVSFNNKEEIQDNRSKHYDRLFEQCIAAQFANLDLSSLKNSELEDWLSRLQSISFYANHKQAT